MNTIKSISRFAQLQHGVVARYQLLEDNVSKNSIDSAVKSGLLKAMSKGVYATVGSQDCWEQRAAIATLSCGREGFLSHESALMLFDLLPKQRDRISRRRPNAERNQLIHVTTPRNMQFDRNVYFHRTCILDNSDRGLVHNGIKHLSIERCIIDAAQQLNETELDYAIDRALSKSLISVRHLFSRLATLKSAPGRDKRRTYEILEPYLKPQQSAESHLEKRAERILNQISARKVRRQHIVNINGRKYRIDLAIPEDQIAIEVDGFEFHKSRSQFDNDRRRQNDLISCGWRLGRVTASFTDEEMRRTFRSLLSTSK